MLARAEEMMRVQRFERGGGADQRDVGLRRIFHYGEAGGAGGGGIDIVQPDTLTRRDRQGSLVVAQQHLAGALDGVRFGLRLRVADDPYGGGFVNIGIVEQALF